MAIAIFVLAICAILQPGSSQSCSLNFTNAVRNCMRPFLEAPPSANFIEGVFMTYVDTEMLNTACRQRIEMDQCVRNVGSCNSIWEVPEFVGLNDSLTDICGNGRKAFEKYQLCTLQMKPLYEASFNLCKLMLPMVTNQNDPLQSCRHTLGIYSCYVNSSKLFCDSEDFMINYCKTLHQPMKADIACRFDYKDWNIKELNMVCNLTKVDECMAEFHPPGQYKIFGDGSIMTTPVNNQQLADACRAIRIDSLCLNYTGRCTWLEEKNAGIVDSMNYICSDGKAGFQKFQGCTSNGGQTFQQKVSNCQRNLPEVTNLNISGQVCRRQNGLYLCYVNAAKETCDSETFMINYYLKLNQIALRKSDCKLDILATDASMYSKCDSFKLNNCISKMKTIDMDLHTLKLIPLSSSQLKDYCMVVYDTHRCVQEQAMCSDMDKVSLANWTGIRNKWNYICLENMNGFNRLQNCIQRDKEFFMREHDRCLKNTQVKLEDYTSYCRMYNDLNNCEIQTAQLLCLEGDFVKEMNFNRFKDYLRETYACEIENKGSKGISQYRSDSMMLFLMNLIFSFAAFVIHSK